MKLNEQPTFSTLPPLLHVLVCLSYDGFPFILRLPMQQITQHMGPNIIVGTSLSSDDSTPRGYSTRELFFTDVKYVGESFSFLSTMFA